MGRKPRYHTDAERKAARHETIRAAGERHRARKKALTPLQKEVEGWVYTAEEEVMVRRLKDLQTELDDLARRLNRTVLARLDDEGLVRFLEDGFTRLELPNH